MDARNTLQTVPLHTCCVWQTFCAVAIIPRIFWHAVGALPGSWCREVYLIGRSIDAPHSIIWRCLPQIFWILRGRLSIQNTTLAIQRIRTSSVLRSYEYFPLVSGVDGTLLWDLIWKMFSLPTISREYTQLKVTGSSHFAVIFFNLR